MEAFKDGDENAPLKSTNERRIRKVIFYDLWSLDSGQQPLKMPTLIACMPELPVLLNFCACRLVALAFVCWSRGEMVLILLWQAHWFVVLVFLAGNTMNGYCILSFFFCCRQQTVTVKSNIQHTKKWRYISNICLYTHIRWWDPFF